MSGISKKSKKIKKRQKKKKDPNAPKRPRSPYIIYTQALRGEVKKLHPNARPSELMQIMGKLWKNLSDAEKKPYIDQAKTDKQRFSTQMKDYSAVGSESEDGSGKGKRDPNKPKRGMSAYLYFSKAMRDKVKAEHQSARSAELMQIMGKMWKELSDDQKRPFVEAAKKDKDRYQSQKAQYQVAAGNATATRANQSSAQAQSKDEEEEEEEDGEDDEEDGDEDGEEEDEDDD